MSIAKIWYLEQFNLLQELPKEELSWLAEQMPLHRVYKGNILRMGDASSPAVYFLKSGLVKIGSYTASGEENLKYLVKEGQIFGEQALVGKENPNDFAEALEDSLVCPINTQTMKWLMDRFPALNQAVLHLMGDRVERLEAKLSALLYEPSRQRIQRFLVQHLEEFGQQQGAEWRVKNNLKHSDIARLTATSRQTVNSVLNELRRVGLIDYDKDWIWTHKLAEVKRNALQSGAEE
ncbi:MAG: Crp/Fnr family transcriptional regulator [Bacteroidota bacterium]